MRPISATAVSSLLSALRIPGSKPSSKYTLAMTFYLQCSWADPYSSVLHRSTGFDNLFRQLLCIARLADSNNGLPPRVVRAILDCRKQLLSTSEQWRCRVFLANLSPLLFVVVDPLTVRTSRLWATAAPPLGMKGWGCDISLIRLLVCHPCVIAGHPVLC